MSSDPFAAGPLATQLLAEQSVEVVKVEPLTGDLMRVGPTEGFRANYANRHHRFDSAPPPLDSAAKS